MPGHTCRIALQFSGHWINEDSERLTNKNRFDFDLPTSKLKAPGVLKNVEIEVTSKQSIQLINNYIAGQAQIIPLEFDCVGFSTDSHMKMEVSNIIDQMFLQQKNSFLLRFNSTRCCQLPFICNLLVSEVDRCMQYLHGKIFNIKFEYYELRKYDVVNMLNHGASKKGKNVSSAVQFVEFNSTLDFMKWLQHKYPALWANSSSHECFHISYQYMDEQRYQHSLKLAVVCAYMVNLDTESKNNLGTFMKNLGSSKRTKHTMIGDYIKEYFNGKEQWRNLILFDIPLNNGFVGIVSDMISLAVNSHEGIAAINSREKTLRSVNRALIGTELERNTKKALTKNVSNAKSEQNVASPNYNMYPNSLLKDNTYQQLFTVKQWHKKIDDCFASVLSASEAFYNRKYQQKSSEICHGIKLMGHNINNLTSFDPNTDIFSDHISIMNGNNINKLNNTNDDIDTYYVQYKMVMSDLQRLLSEIEHTEFNETLRLYMRSKNTELKNNVLQIKLKQFEICQKQMNAAIKAEINILKAQNQKTVTFAYKIKKTT